MSTDGKYSAFIDLLATKQSLDIGKDEYFSSLNRFRQSIENTIDRLDVDDSVFMFSDCAYISFEDIEGFYQYINFLTKSLAAQDLYFRVSVVPGELQPREVSVSPNIDGGAASLHGYTFDESAVYAFLLHEKFKGIGAIIDERIVNNQILVECCYFRSDRKDSITRYNTFRLSFDSLEEEMEIARNFSIEFRKQNTMSRRIGRYYFSFIINWIRSTDFSDMEEFDDGEKVLSNKPIYDILLNDRRFIKSIDEMIGFDYVYFCLYSHMKKYDVEDNYISSVCNKISSKSYIRKNIGSTPNFIIKEKDKISLLKSIS